MSGPAVVGVIDHRQRAAGFIAEDGRSQWHDKALWFVRSKRDRAVATIPEWERLRSHGAAIKAHVVANLGHYLEEFICHAEAAGATVHVADDAAEHNRIVQGLLQQHGAKKVVKSKSMLTESCGLNDHLQQHCIEVIDTDLGERIVQLAKQPPSHIVLPAIHFKKEEVGALFHEHLHTPKGLDDALELTRAARAHLRERFMGADAAITGVNFAVAETGSIVICTNEGNMDFGTALPDLHIACMGLEKLVPKSADLSVFTRLLARSATGQAITTYTSHLRGPKPKGALHIVIVDDGRSAHAADAETSSSLACIRCGACMNTCPIFRRAGGHSYGTTIPGPIGIVLAPHKNASTARNLPDACSVCGSCSDVCPVKIPLHQQILTWRSRMAERGYMKWTKRTSMHIGAWVLRHPRVFRPLSWLGRRSMRLMPQSLRNALAGNWGLSHDVPVPPKQSFQAQWKAHKKNQESGTGAQS